MSNFVDKVRISVRAGNGGNGAVAFHREKYVAAGGPDGGDGGRGGNIILHVDDNMSTLLDFRYKRKYVAPNGADGKGARCKGKAGENLTIRVPRGTVVRDAETNQIIADMSESEDFVLCKGGRGGWGNQHFATPTRQVPRFAKAGLPGEAHEVVLELKLLADVGLVGFPNVGKSTLLSVTSNAHPKIANYHFTTLFPNLGVIYVDEGVSFVMADIPGIIEGAAEGAGLGHDFLRHIDRCRLLVHVVDVSGSEGRDPVEDFEKICDELSQYSPDLAERPMIVAANKIDLLEPDSDNLARLRAVVEAKGCEFFEISAATTQGTRELVRHIAGRLASLPPILTFEPDYVKPLAEAGDAAALQIERFDDVWSISGDWLRQLVGDINFDDAESRMYFDRQLRKSGLFEKLEEMGIRDGDTVSLYDLEFVYER
jgi:GTP-binding protein